LWCTGRFSKPAANSKTWRCCCLTGDCIRLWLSTLMLFDGLWNIGPINAVGRINETWYTVQHPARRLRQSNNMSTDYSSLPNEAERLGKGRRDWVSCWVLWKTSRTISFNRRSTYQIAGWLEGS
jgi:hypothetical protein